VHIHFDAKYKVESLQGIFGKDDNLEEENEEQKKGHIQKSIDLLKMHTYKDAIRRTAGAYVLYPGTEAKYLPDRISRADSRTWCIFNLSVQNKQWNVKN
jgi:predicted component of viral defense system (DUF524 family)